MRCQPPFLRGKKYKNTKKVKFTPEKLGYKFFFSDIFAVHTPQK